MSIYTSHLLLLVVVVLAMTIIAIWCEGVGACH